MTRQPDTAAKPMGASPIMRVFVVTPYFNTPVDWFAQCHRSVRAQTVPVTQILICDGAPVTMLPYFQGIHLILRRNYADYGNTPRLLGCYQAVTAGADAIAFLDADNWFLPDHVEALLRHAQDNGLDAVSSTRMLHRLDGSPMIRCPHVDGGLIDTNCLLVLRPAFPHLIAWVLTEREQAGVTDQAVWHHLQAQGMRTGFLNRASVAYRTRHRVHYQIAGETPPADAIDRTDMDGDNYH